MRQRTTAALTAVLTAATLTLTACGGDSKSDDKIKGADKADKSDNPSKAPSGGSGRPKIKLPKDVKNVFEDRKTGDPKKDQILADNEERINSVDKAITSGTIKTPAMGFYSSDAALVSAYNFVKGYIEDDRTWTGATRYFDRDVVMLDKKTAVVTYCSDETKANLKDRKTGKVDTEPSSKDSYVYYDTRLEVNDKGVWKTNYVDSKRGSEKCQP